MTKIASLAPDYFEQMFAGDPDPWNLGSSPYESAKYDTTITSLGERRYARALEIGCAGGVLTQRLAPHCDAVIALDVSATALQRARKRNADATHVAFAKMAFPRERPSGQFDLIVLSEVVYYWSDADIAAAGAWIATHLHAGGDVLLVHWTGDTDYPQTGDNAVVRLHAALTGVAVIRADRYEKYRLDLWRM